MPIASAPCTSTILEGGRVTLSCATSVSYTVAGTAQATADLTNGYSTSHWSFPNLLVAPPLGVGVSPSSIIAYAGSSTPLTVAVGVGSGTPPFGPACLWPGDGRLACSTGPGPTYSFSVTYATAGRYDGRVTIADSGAGNVSRSFGAWVFDRPTLDSITLPSNQLPVGGSLTLSSRVVGGALPITYWWNSTTPAGTLLEGVATNDGPILFDFVPHAAGTTNITLSIVDALGSTQFHDVRITALAGPTVGIAATSGDGNGTATAGAPYPVRWAAVDPVGEVVNSGWGPIDLAILPPTGNPDAMVWVNDSTGAVNASAFGRYTIPASDWRSGYLAFSIAVGAAGRWTVRASAGLPILDLPGGSMSLMVRPDLDHVALTHPTIARAGDRANATLWQIADRFGDPIPDGFVLVKSVFGGVAVAASSGIRSDGMVSTVWVNYSAPSEEAGTIYVLGGAGYNVLLTIDVPAGPSPISVPLVLALVAAAAVALAASYYAYRRRSGPTEPDGPAHGGFGETTEEELRRLAEGRAHVLARADPDRGRTLDELAGGFPDRAPTVEELTDWVASLIADGSLRTLIGPDGKSRFLRVDRGETEPPPRVRLDDAALRAALDRRDAERADEPPPPPGEP